MARHHATLLVGLAASLTLVAACGDDEPESAATTVGDAPATTTGAPATTAAPATPAPPPTAPATDPPPPTTPAPPTTATSTTEATADVPTRIVSLSPTHTEILFAIGAGGQVIAVDDQSNFPEAAVAVQTDLSGFEPNVEAIADYDPDLVVFQVGTDLVPQLGSLDIPTYEAPVATTFAEAYTQIEQLGATTGHVAEAAGVVATMTADIAALAASLPPSETPLTVYHELSPDYYSANSSTFIGQVYSALGLQNIADRAEGDSGGYPQLSAEAIIDADPDLIFLADTKCCGESFKTVRGRPGWQDMTAVVDGRVFEMDDDVASRWGPRIVDYMRQVAEAVVAVRELEPTG